MDDVKPPELNEAQRGLLSLLAWRALRAHLDGGEVDVDELLSGEGEASVLRQKCGVFVTLRRGEDLRGCMGRVVAEELLAHGVVANAVAAAGRDPRFPALTCAEVDGLGVEISVLGNLVPLPVDAAGRLRAVEPGTHGVFVRSGERRGVLLPQVARLFGWDSEELLRQTCRKAGLDTGAWRLPEVEVSIFTSTSFEALEPGARRGSREPPAEGV